MNKYAEYVKKNLTGRDMLEQLAEESCELGQAAMKLIRAFSMGGNKNATPVTKNDASANLVEEATDVLGVLYLLGILKEEELPVFVVHNAKFERWAKRLGYKEEALGEINGE